MPLDAQETSYLAESASIECESRQPAYLRHLRSQKNALVVCQFKKFMLTEIAIIALLFRFHLP